MAAFDYKGHAYIHWPDGRITTQFICYWADTGTLRVWPENDEIEESEYLGHINDHPASRIEFRPDI